MSLQWLVNAYQAWLHSVPSVTAGSGSASFQSYFEYSPIEAVWGPTTRKQSATILVTGSESASLRFRIVSWNVDYAAPGAATRLGALLSKLPALCAELDIIVLQEVSFVAIPSLLDSPWIRSEWLISDIDHKRWKGAYGTVTLLRRGSALVRYVGPLYRVPLKSNYHRDALCCDFLCDNRRIRVINVHLDSLNINPPTRGDQLATCAAHLRAAGSGAIIGDFNPVSPGDTTLVKNNGLRDAWVELNGESEDESGYTWGIQKTERFPAKRMDRAAVLALTPITVDVLKCSTVDVKGQEVFWSDHCGLSVVLDFPMS